MYLELRRRVWHALHDIPADAQDALGRRRFCVSLKTGDRRTAERRAVPIEAKWRGAIEVARKGGRKDALEGDAAFWRDALADARRQDEASGASSDEGVEAIVQGLLQDEAETRFSGRTEEAVRFYNHASGKLVGFSEHLEDWLSSVSNKAKTVDEKRSWIKRFAAKHAYVQDVTRKLVQAWVNSLAKDDGLSPDSIHKALSSLRGYWKYLISLEVAAEDSLPFERVTVPKVNPKLARQEFALLTWCACTPKPRRGETINSLT